MSEYTYDQFCQEHFGETYERNSREYWEKIQLYFEQLEKPQISEVPTKVLESQNKNLMKKTK